MPACCRICERDRFAVSAAKSASRIRERERTGFPDVTLQVADRRFETRPAQGTGLARSPLMTIRAESTVLSALVALPERGHVESALIAAEPPLSNCRRRVTAKDFSSPAVICPSAHGFRRGVRRQPPRAPPPGARRHRCFSRSRCRIGIWLYPHLDVVPSCIRQNNLPGVQSERCIDASFRGLIVDRRHRAERRSVPRRSQLKDTCELRPRCPPQASANRSQQRPSTGRPFSTGGGTSRRCWP